MKSLPRIMKQPEEEEKIQPYDFFSGFTIQNKEEPEEEQEEPVEETVQEVSADEYIRQAEEKAELILRDAREQAELLREQGYAEGRKLGYEEGVQDAYEEQRMILDKEIQALQTNVADVIRSVSTEKEKLMETVVDDLKKISLAVAEKIIQTSLQSSEDIIKRIILAATDKMKKRQWAKIYITKCNTGISLEADVEFLERLSRLSDNVKIVTMDNAEEGTCIIELPDEVIDASVGTQLKNIKDIINNARV